jgi:hypothetical protein
LFGVLTCKIPTFFVEFLFVGDNPWEGRNVC